MSMTFLQLASRLRQEVGGAGTGPSAVTNQTGESKRIVDWIATADEDIQRSRNQWRFMRSGFTVNTVANTAAYAYTSCTDTTASAAIATFREWVKDSFKIYLSSAGVGSETPLDFIDYDDWYALYSTGTQTASVPAEFTVLNNLSFSLGPKPDAVYVVTGEYQKAVVTMDSDGDTPLYPSEYHMLPVYRAMMSYGRYTGATEVYQEGQMRYRELMAEMERTQLPDLELATAE